MSFVIVKYLSVFILAIVGGILGSYLFTHSEQLFGATTARTTITNPWIFSATTTNNANVVVTTTNAATSSVQVGCIQMTATSTATPIKLLVNQQATTTTLDSATPRGVVLWAFGKCPRI